MTFARRQLHLVVALLLAACGEGDGPPPDNGVDPTPTDPPVISSVAPDPLQEGGTATITGQNFSSTAGANLVRIDGEQAIVTQASTTQLTVTVPQVCGASRLGAVTVSVNSRTSDAVTVSIEPNARTVDLEVGEQAICRSDGVYCLELPASADSVQYLVGIQSVNEDGTITTATRLRATRGSVAAATTATPAPTEAATLQRSAPRFDLERVLRDPTLRRQRAHFRDHERRLEADLEFLRALGGRSDRSSVGAARVDGPAAVGTDGSETVGDRVDFRVRNFTQSGCDVFSPITAELKIKTGRTMWFVDVDNPSNGYSDAQLQALSDLFEDTVLDTSDEMFGFPSDYDDNEHVVIVITKAINEFNGSQGQTVGFVNPCDFETRDVFPNSNEGEYFYTLAPDPNSELGQEWDLDFLMDFMPRVLAHEYTHITQFSRNFEETPLRLPFLFEAEGQATYAEEIVGHVALGFGPGQNLGGAEAWDFDELLDAPWYANGFGDLAFYFGFESGGKVSGAPEQCTWTDDVEDPCGSRPSWYGVTWSFLRWAADHFADDAGGEDVLQKALIDSNEQGFGTFEDVYGAYGSLPDLLAQWAAALYVDERIPGDPNPLLTVPSWDLRDVDEAVVTSAHLEPRLRTFSTFSDNATVRSPSTAYWLISGRNTPSLSLQASSATGSDLPDHVQVWIVRMN